MTTLTPGPSTSADSGRSAAVGVRPRRQALALARAETILLLRNKTALFTATVIPLLLVGLFAVLPNALTGPPVAMGMVIGSVLMFVLYYTLVTSTVARREEHTLKRLYSSAARPSTVLIGMALPLLGLVLVQVIIGLLAVAALMGLGSAPRPWLLIVAVAAGCAVWWVLALASVPFTRSVEAAQLTTMPLLLAAIGLSGLSVPIGLLPDPVAWVAQVSPMFPVIDLSYLALSSTRVSLDTVEGAALWSAVGIDLAVAAAWVLAGLWLVRRRFAWEPRR